MDRTTVSFSIPYILRDKLLSAVEDDRILSDTFSFDEEDEAEEQGVRLATFEFFDIHPSELPETKLQEIGIPYKMRIHPTLSTEGETCQFRVQSDGTHVITGYKDRENARCATLDELREARHGGLRAIDALINAKETAFPVLAWRDQLDILREIALSGSSD